MRREKSSRSGRSRRAESSTSKEEKSREVHAAPTCPCHVSVKTINVSSRPKLRGRERQDEFLFRRERLIMTARPSSGARMRQRGGKRGRKPFVMIAGMFGVVSKLWSILNFLQCPKPKPDPQRVASI